MNTEGRVVDIAKSDASLLRGKRGRQSKCFRANDIRALEGYQLIQVLLKLRHAISLDVVEVSVIEKTFKTPSRRNTDKTTTLLVQVPPGTHDARSLVCLAMSGLESTGDILTAKPKKGKPLFSFNQTNGKKKKSKASEILHRMKGCLNFQLVMGMERNAAGNKGYHDLSKDPYSEDMVWLFGHRLLVVDDQGILDAGKVALIHNNKIDNPAWSFEDLPRC